MYVTISWKEEEEFHFVLLDKELPILERKPQISTTPAVSMMELGDQILHVLENMKTAMENLSVSAAGALEGQLRDTTKGSNYIAKLGSDE